jgi:hypothetical protein
VPRGPTDDLKQAVPRTVAVHIRLLQTALEQDDPSRFRAHPCGGDERADPDGCRRVIGTIYGGSL